MLRLFSLVIAVAALVAVASLIIAAPPAEDKNPTWTPVLPAHELKPFAEQITAALKKPVEALAGGQLDEDDRERAVKKARGLTLFLAAGAQTTAGTGDGSEKRGPLFNASMQLDQALRGGKFGDAKSTLDALPAGANFDKPPFGPAPLADARGRDDAVAALMAQFRIRAAGGLGVEPRPKERTDDGLEAMLKLLGEKGTGGPKPDDTARFAYRLAIMAEALRSLPPRPKGEKDPAKWSKWSAEMRADSLELAKTAANGDRAALRQAALRVSRSCVDCHKVFRDN
jgi:hypothetical protein